MLGQLANFWANPVDFTLSLAQVETNLADGVNKADEVSKQAAFSQANSLQVRKTPSWPRCWANFSLYRCIPIGMHGPTCVFWANLTACSLQTDDALPRLLTNPRVFPKVVDLLGSNIYCYHLHVNVTPAAAEGTHQPDADEIRAAVPTFGFHQVREPAFTLTP